MNHDESIAENRFSMVYPTQSASVLVSNDAYETGGFEDDNTVIQGVRQPDAGSDNDSSDDDDYKLTNSSNIACIKRTIIFSLILSGVIIGTISYLHTTRQEFLRFQDAFRDDAARFVQSFNQETAIIRGSLYSLSSTVSSIHKNDKISAGPNVTILDFELLTMGSRFSSQAASIFYAPIITDEDQSSWENYATKHKNLSGINDNPKARPIEDGIFSLDTSSLELVNDRSSKTKAPIWQINPSLEKRHLIMLNILSVMENSFPGDLYNMSSLMFQPFLQPTLANFLSNCSLSSADISPRSISILPVKDGKQTVALVGIEIDWSNFFAEVVPDGPRVNIVLKNSCGQIRTYSVKQGNVSYLNSSDLHELEYENLSIGTTPEGIEDSWNHYIHGSNQFHQRYYPDEPGNCFYQITVFPTSEYHGLFHTGLAITYTIVAISLSMISVLLVVVYGVMVDRRQRQVIDRAAKSNAIIKSLFPAVILKRLFRADLHQRNEHSSFPAGSLGLRRVFTSHDGDGMGNPKSRLANFLSTPPNDNHAMEHDDEPIAEMFSNTTVMFADIAGFTAWSSEREPSQVFKLLETLYHEFDNIADCLGVFKVETIGDCYVAVSGLPTPNKDHAKTMARFAHEILMVTNQLTQNLECILGPGTSDLGLRVGLHSGPVTAGVLRGSKSRFQLFGDTMNTASRIESTGQAGKIQASEVTADLIRKAGKSYWLKRREGTITAKGKGELQTYWVEVCRARVESITKSQEPNLSTTDLIEKNDALSQSDLRVWGNVPGDLESSLSRHSFSEKESRLIDWNVAVLMNFLEKVVGHRIINLNRNSITHGMSVSENGSTNEFLPNEVSSGLIIDEVAEVISLPRFNSSHTMIPSSSRILPSEIRGQMKEFVTAIASMYRQVPFHNFEHASHVTMSANKLMKRIITPEDTSKRPHDVSYALHMSTFGISSDPLTQFAVVFAALIHDVDHTGLSNEQLVKEDATIARIFKNKSVAEQNSVVLAWDLLMESRFSELQECIFANNSDRIRFRQLVVNAVMATDVLDKDMVALRKKRWEKAFDPSLSGEAFILDIDIHRKATIVIEHIIQASDVAHTMQHWHVFIKWNTKLYHELHRAYVNGHSYQDPSINWYQGQLSFFDDYVIPLAMKLRECGVFGVSGDEYLNYAILNRNEWEQKGKEETQKMIRFTRSVMSSGRWKPELSESSPIELGDHSMELVN